MHTTQMQPGQSCNTAGVAIFPVYLCMAGAAASGHPLPKHPGEGGSKVHHKAGCRVHPAPRGAPASLQPSLPPLSDTSSAVPEPREEAVLLATLC